MLAVSSHEKKVSPDLFTWINQNRSRGWSEGWTGNVRSSFIRAARRVSVSGHVCLTWTGCSCSELRLVMLQHRFHTAFLEGAIQKTLGSFVQYVHTCLWVCSARTGPSQSFELTFSCLFDLLLRVTGPDRGWPVQHFNSAVQTSVNPPCVSLKNERKQRLKLALLASYVTEQIWHVAYQPPVSPPLATRQWRSVRGKETRRKLDQEKIKEHNKTWCWAAASCGNANRKKGRKVSPIWEHLAVPCGQVEVRVLLPTPKTLELQKHNRWLQGRHSVSFRTKRICKLDLCFKVDQVCSNLSLVDQSSFVRLTAHNNPSLSDSGPQFMLRLKQAPPSFKPTFWLPSLHNGWGFWDNLNRDIPSLGRHTDPWVEKLWFSECLKPSAAWTSSSVEQEAGNMTTCLYIILLFLSR